MKSNNCFKKLVHKTTISNMLLSIILLVAFSSPCFANSISLTINNKSIDMPVNPVNESDTTLVPLRVITENMGATLNFDNTSKTINLKKDDNIISLTIGSKNATVNDSPMTLSLEPKLINNTTMVPIRFISENFECIVNWISEKQLIEITLPEVEPDTTTPDLETDTTIPEVDSKKVLATIIIEGYGTLELELYPEMAPKTVENFTKLANSNFYDGLTFHRIISSFMIQGGDPTANGTGGPGYSIYGEFASNGFAQNTLRHTKGVISMARSADPNSAGSQFFIMSGDSPHLDGNYAAFGKVTKGIDIIDKIEKVETQIGDKPVTDVVIKSIKVHNN